jgi:TolA-binding protein
MEHRRTLSVALLAAAALWSVTATGASASGGGEPAPWYLDEFGGDATDLRPLYDGRLGIIMARSPRPQLLIAWRLLHGLKVGQSAGAALSIPCCDAPERPQDADHPASGTEGWLTARKLVASAPELGTYLSTERDGPNYTSIQTCFPDAFDTASATLKDRIARYGAGSPGVQAWLAAQDAVFRACHDDGVTLPVVAPGAAAWLKADHAYQEAALALYSGRYGDAATRFQAIARDPASPWRPTGLYLTARALEREALAHPSAPAFAQARAAIAALQSAPANTYGRERCADMLRVLAFRDQPARLLAELDRELSQPEPPADVAVAFRDYAQLADRADDKPEAMDWIATLLPSPTAQADQAALSVSPQAQAQLVRQVEIQALAHARSRWTASHDVAWLLAALSLADPGDPAAAPLIADGARVPASSPAWLTVQHHIVRLTLASGDKDGLRARLDAILKRTDLSVGDRNIFTAARMEVARDPDEFVHLALRRRLCIGDTQVNGCVRERWFSDSYQVGGVFDGAQSEGTVGFGEDARAVIDRLPLAQRDTLATSPALPARLRLDVALTSFTRAVQLQDEAAVDRLARVLVELLPQLKADWSRIAAAPPGAQKRFAEFFVMAKIPGLRTDLVEYTRPEGGVADFQQYWTDWIILPAHAPAADLQPQPTSAYQTAGVAARADLVCLGECGVGASPLRLPDFAAAVQAQASRERGYFFSADHAYDKPPPTPPPGAADAWDEMLGFIQAHPADPRAPEALYWLVHVGRFGGSHNHSGRRAFRLLHQRYGHSTWAGKTPYFYD